MRAPRYTISAIVRAPGRDLPAKTTESYTISAHPDKNCYWLDVNDCSDGADALALIGRVMQRSFHVPRDGYTVLRLKNPITGDYEIPEGENPDAGPRKRTTEETAHLFGEDVGKDWEKHFKSRKKKSQHGVAA